MRWNLKELTDISGKEHRKIKKMLHFLIEKYTRYGIIYLQSVDTKGTDKVSCDTKPFVGDWGKGRLE